MLASFRPPQTYERRAIVAVDAHDDTILVVLEGEVHVIRPSGTHREIVLFTASRGELLNLAQINPAVRPNWTIRALKRSTIYRIPLPTFRRVMCQHVEMAVQVVDLLAVRKTHLLDLIEELAFSSLRTRVVHVLVQCVHDTGSQVVAVTHEELAALVGTSREEVTRTLSALREQGLIQYPPHSRQIEIPDPDRLLDEIPSVGFGEDGPLPRWSVQPSAITRHLGSLFAILPQW